MKRHTWLILLVILVLASLSCNWLTSLDAALKSTPTAVTVAAATPTGNPPLVLPRVDEGGVAAEEALLTGLYEQVSPSVVHIQVVQGEGSGFVWDENGHIVTNNHVVQGAAVVQVSFFDGTILDAEIVGLDPQSDIAVLRVDPSAVELRPVTLGDSDNLRVGRMAVAIGNPFGQTWTMTQGIVSALDRTIRSGVSLFSIPEVIQTDAAINPGNSGGPLLDSSGQVIGMNTMILSRSGVSSGVGFAVPVNIVKLVVPELVGSGRYAYAWLGITGRDLFPEDVETMDLSVRQGALVTEVVGRGPADQARIRVSDVVIAVEDETVRGMADLIAYLVRHTRPDQEVMLKVIRDGREVELPVVLGERPSR